jgi:hypothetical protein
VHRGFRFHQRGQRIQVGQIGAGIIQTLFGG